MLEYYSQHPLLAFLVISLALIAIAVLINAIKVSSARSKKVNDLMDKMKEDNIIKNKFAILTKELAEEAECAELFKGVGLNLQKRVADGSDMLAEFNSLNDSQKYIYSLCSFCEDASSKMSEFFKLNTKPLTDTALKAAEVIIGGEFYELFLAEYKAYDPDDEVTSLIPEDIEEIDKKAAPFIDNGTVADKCGEYIKNNIADFII